MHVVVIWFKVPSVSDIYMNLCKYFNRKLLCRILPLTDWCLPNSSSFVSAWSTSGQPSSSIISFFSNILSFIVTHRKLSRYLVFIHKWQQKLATCVVTQRPVGQCDWTDWIGFLIIIHVIYWSFFRCLSSQDFPRKDECIQMDTFCLSRHVWDWLCCAVGCTKNIFSQIN